jgi:hypothetical protein
MPPEETLGGQLRQTWAEFACNQDRMESILFGRRVRIRVAPPSIEAWRALATVLRTHNYEVRYGETAAYNCRVAGDKTPRSSHAYGIALDTNWETNPFKETPDGRSIRYSDKPTQADRAEDVRQGIADTDMTPAIIADVSRIATKDGQPVFEWGGIWKMRKDPMHFEIVLSPQELKVGIDPATVAGARANTGTQ